MEYLGLLPERDKDVFGFGFYQGEGSEEQRREVNVDFEREFAYEMYYSILVTPWLALTPDFQYVVDPGGDTDADDAIVVGLRARFVF